MQTPPGRLQQIRSPIEAEEEKQDFQVIVDRANNTFELDNLLTLARNLPGCERIILVIGCDGDVSDEQRVQRKYLAEMAHHRADVVIFTNASYRTEPPNQIIQEMVAGLPKEIYTDWEFTSENLLQDPFRCNPVRHRLQSI